MNAASNDIRGDAAGKAISGSKRPIDSPSSSKKAEKPNKRLRVSRACDQCRAARERCDGAQPDCSTCSQSDRTCSYKEQPKKRGIQPNYIRTLELTLTWLFQSHPDAERQLAEVLPNTEGQAHRTIAFKDVRSADALHHVWRNGIICRQIDQILSGSDIEIPQLPHSPPDAAQLTAVALGSAPYQSPPLSAPSDAEALQADHDIIAGLGGSSATDAGDTSKAPNENFRLLRLPGNAWALLEHYFAFTQSWLPITEKHDILRLMYAYPSEGLSKSESLGAEYAELWAIMALSAFCLRSDGSSDDYVVYTETARSLTPASNCQFGHVKALLILSLIEITQASWMSAWLTVGTAVRMLTHLAAAEFSSRDPSHGRIRHIFLAAYLLESAISLKTGALTHLRTADIEPMGLLVEDGLDEWSPWSDPSNNAAAMSAKEPARSISAFNELIRASQCGRDCDPVHERHTTIDVILELLSNACLGAGRRRPSSLVQDFASRINISQNASKRPITPSTSAMNAQSLDHVDLDDWDRHHHNQYDGIAEHHDYPYASIPIEARNPLCGNAPAQGGSLATLGTWQGTGLQTSTNGSTTANSILHHPSNHQSADIFEELAVLDRTDSNQNPRFMENLGFGPDLDLAEFFGADYQPSDSTINYMQSEQPGNLTGDVDHGGEVTR